MDTKALLARLVPLFPGHAFPKSGACLEVAPDGSVVVKYKGAVIRDVTPYVSFAFDLTNEFFNGTFDLDDDAERGSSLFPIQMTINLPGLYLVLNGIATESSTAGPLKNGLQKKTNSTRAKLFGQGSYTPPGGFPGPVLAEGSLTTNGKGEVPD
jgi:hypothetical protein